MKSQLTPSEDFEKKHLDGGSGKYFYDERSAQTVMDFIENECHHVTGKWADTYDAQGNRQDTRIKLADWHKELVLKPLFGVKKTSTGTRRYTTLYLFVPKKNAKSTFAACLQVVLLYLDRASGSEIYCASAASEKQAASLLLEPARQMIDKNPRLSAHATITGVPTKTERIVVRNNDRIAFCKALTRDPKNAEGIKPQAGFVDEVHVFSEMGVIDNMRKSMVIRDQPLMVYTTTAGKGVQSVGYDLDSYYADVASGKIIDESALVVRFAADEDDDPFDEATWKKANPMYGISINPEMFAQEAERAKRSAADMNAFRRYHLNQWTGESDSWLADHVWQASYWELDENDLAGQPCYGGLDIGTKSDLTAFTLLFPQKDGRVVSKSWFWVPSEAAQGSADYKNVAYLDWVQKGYIEETDGNIADHDYIVSRIIEICAKHKVLGLGYDPHQASQIAAKLQAAGVGPLYTCRSGYISMNEPCMHLTELVTGGKFNHLNNPVMRWQVGNTEMINDSTGNIKPDRRKRHQKIDGVLSNLYALMVKMEEDKKSKPISYLLQNDLKRI